MDADFVDLVLASCSDSFSVKTETVESLILEDDSFAFPLFTLSGLPRFFDGLWEQYTPTLYQILFIVVL